MLVAIDDNDEYLNPSLIPLGQRDDIVRFIRRKTNNDLIFCPHCLVKTNLRHPVSLVNPSEKIIHFRHKKGNREHECDSYRGESDHHLTAKLAILASLSTSSESVEVESRKYSETSGDRVFRTPDVTAVLENGTLHAHEVQVSSIRIDQLSERTIALINDLGFAHVHWYLGKKNIKDENVNFLIDHPRTTAYQLIFDNDGIPGWTPMYQKIMKLPSYKSESEHGTIYFRLDSEGIRWTYHTKADTLAIYLGKQGRQHTIRLPGASAMTVSSELIRDPASSAAGGIQRWPLLQP